MRQQISKGQFALVVIVATVVVVVGQWIFKLASPASAGTWGAHAIVGLATGLIVGFIISRMMKAPSGH